MYLKRAGLVALVFALLASLVSAVPLPISASHSGLSSTLSSRSNSNGRVLIQRDSPRVAQVARNDRISVVSLTSRANNTPFEDAQLVRRESIAAKIRGAFKKLGRGIKHIAQKIGSGIKKVAKKIGSGIKTVAKKIGSGIKTAAKKVGTFIKHTGAKIVKFALKVAAVATEAVSKVVGFIPGIGKPLGKAMEGVSKLENFGSNKIHANLGKKLEKGMNVMNKADKIMGYIPRRRDLSEEGVLQQRDISDGYYFEKRHDIPLAYREEPYFDVEERDIY